MKKLINELLYDLIRDNYLIEVITSIGNFDEDDEKIICYGKQSVIDRKMKKKSNIYELQLYGMNTININEERKKKIDYYHLDKPVYYIFENIEFKNTVKICSRFANIIFRNCSFHDDIIVMWADDITFENCKYFDSGLLKHRQYFLRGKFGNLTFRNNNFTNSCDDHNLTRFGINVHVNDIKMINSKIEIESPNELNINAKNTVIIESIVNAPKIYIESDSIICDKKSQINANEGIIIDNKYCDPIYNVKTPYFVYNGEELFCKKTKNVDKDIIELRKARLRVIEQLRNLKSMCEDLNLETINKVEKSLEQKKIYKILKNKV